MIARRLLAAAVLLSAVAADGAAPDSPEGTAADPKADRKICRTERVTGSLTRRSRICLTAAQWREIEAKTGRGVADLQRSASGSRACRWETEACYQSPEREG